LIFLSDNNGKNKEKYIGDRAPFNCEMCLDSGAALSRFCTKYSREYILSRNPRAEEMAKRSLRSVSRRISKRNKDTQSDKPIIFNSDGYEHRYCPVCDATKEIQSIIDDTLYCIDSNSLPDPGGAMDQTEIFRIASTVLRSEREKIKNEKEKAAMDKKSSSSGSSISRGRRKLSR